MRGEKDSEAVQKQISKLLEAQCYFYKQAKKIECICEPFYRRL